MENINEKNKKELWSIQIKKPLYNQIKKICKECGFKINGFIEVSALSKISGSKEFLDILNK